MRSRLCTAWADNGAVTSTAGSALISLTSIPDIVRLLVVVFGCAIFAGLLRKWTGLGNGRDEIWATARATVQLLVVGLIITAVLGSWWLTALFVTVMVAVAMLPLTVFTPMVAVPAETGVTRPVSLTVATPGSEEANCTLASMPLSMPTSSCSVST